MTSNTTSRFRPTLETLEDRQLLSWASVPPAVVNLNAPSDTRFNISFGTAGGYSQANTITTNEVDYRKFVAQRTGVHTFEAQATAGSRIDTVAGLFDTAGRRLASNDDFGGSNNSKFTLSLVAGRTYQFGITNFNGSPNGGYRAIITPPSVAVSAFKSGSGFRSTGTATLSGSNLRLKLDATNTTTFGRHTHFIQVQILGLNGTVLFSNVFRKTVDTAGTLVPGTPTSTSKTWDISLASFNLAGASSLRVTVG